MEWECITHSGGTQGDPSLTLPKSPAGHPLMAEMENGWFSLPASGMGCVRPGAGAHNPSPPWSARKRNPHGITASPVPDIHQGLEIPKSMNPLKGTTHYWSSSSALVVAQRPDSDNNTPGTENCPLMGFGVGDISSIPAWRQHFPPSISCCFFSRASLNPDTLCFVSFQHKEL